MKTLKISLVASGKVNEADFEVQKILKKRFSALKESIPSFPYSEFDFISFSFNDEPNLISKNTISALNPAKYLKCKEILKDKIAPILAVRKSKQQTPYYPAFFIGNKFSEINSIRSNKIQKIYAVDDDSTSGYIAPIYKLWESGVIQTPNAEGIKEKGWDLIFVGKHTEVENRVIEDEYSIGMTGQFSSQNEPEKSKIKPLLRYYYLPQDVLVLSYELIPFKEEIKKLFNEIFQKDQNDAFINEEAHYFGNSSNRIAGFSEMNNEFQNALNELKVMMKHIDVFSKTKYFPKNIAAGENQNKKTSDKKIQELHDLLINLKEKEVLNYLEEHFENEKDKIALNEVILIASSFNSLAQRQRLGLIKIEDYNISSNNIRKSILDIIETYL